MCLEECKIDMLVRVARVNLAMVELDPIDARLAEGVVWMYKRIVGKYCLERLAIIFNWESLMPWKSDGVEFDVMSPTKGSYQSNQMSVYL
jgi:hypothetical protein